MSDAANLTRVLSSHARSGLTIRDSLRELPGVAPASCRPAAQRAATLIALGAPSGLVLQRLFEELGPPAATAASALRCCLESGGAIATLLDRISRMLDLHDGQASSGRSASAGARLSARMIAGLPLIFVPFMPISGAAPRDGIGALLVLAGVVLGVTGFRWISKLVPRPQESLDRAALLAFVIAATARAGVSPRALLMSLTPKTEGVSDPALVRAGRLLRFGLAWDLALAHSGDVGYTELARSVEVSAQRGIPIAESLENFARFRLAASTYHLEASSKRAPVLMVLPLVLCVLPSFILLAIAPFLRSLFG